MSLLWLILAPETHRRPIIATGRRLVENPRRIRESLPTAAPRAERFDAAEAPLYVG
jgi:hypothetical protein